MVNSIALIIFLLSFIGLGVIFFRKISVLAQLSPQKIELPGFFKRVKDKIRKKRFLKVFYSNILLQRILCKFRIFTLKTENKTSAWLNKLRQKSIKKNRDFPDDYWQELKKKKPK